MSVCNDQLDIHELNNFEEAYEINALLYNFLDMISHDRTSNLQGEFGKQPKVRKLKQGWGTSEVNIDLSFNFWFKWQDYKISQGRQPILKYQIP